MGSQSCCPSSPAIALEACQAHIQRKDYAACQRTKQDVSKTQLYRAVGLFLCPGKVSFKLFHLLLVKHSNPKNNNSLCFFPNLHRLLRPLQCSRHSHLCSAHFPLSWVSLLHAESTHSLFQSDIQLVSLGCAKGLM